MRIYWYWPHPHREPSPLALAMLRPGDQLTVQALASFRGEQLPDLQEYEIVRDLRGPDQGSRAHAVNLALQRSAARRRLVRRGFDVAHLQLLVYYSDWADISHLVRRSTLVGMVHDVRPHDHPFPQALESALLRRMYRRLHGIVVFHETLRRQLVAEFGVDPSAVHVIPIPLDASDLRDRQIRPPEQTTFLFFGALRANKGVEVLLEAARRVEGECEAQVVIAGGGAPAMQERIRQAAAGLRNVRLEFGAISDERKRALFSAASWVVLPYMDFHSQSGVLADAYAYRLPIIVSDVGALGPTVREDRSGIVVRSGDSDELAAALLQAVSDRRHWSRILADAAASHDYSIVGPRLRSVYDVVVGTA